MNSRRSQRLFAAVLPPASAVQELISAVAPLHALPGAVNLRWTPPEGWHYTLGLRLLAARAHAAARKAGVPMEEHRGYTPHLTLARTRVATDLTPYTAALDGFRGLHWEAGELSLVRSHLPVDGVEGEQPRYEVVRAWPLGR